VGTSWYLESFMSWVLTLSGSGGVAIGVGAGWVNAEFTGSS
jgi:hypothetical protein